MHATKSVCVRKLIFQKPELIEAASCKGADEWMIAVNAGVILTY